MTHRYEGSKKLTIAAARAQLQKVGMTLKRDTVTSGPTGSGEYRVTYSCERWGCTPKAAEDAAYYTDDLEDALRTGLEHAKTPPSYILGGGPL